MLFLNLIDLFKIVLDALEYQLLLVLHVSVKKSPNFFSGSSWVKMNIRILFYSLFRSPVQKSKMGPFFLKRILQVGILAVYSFVEFESLKNWLIPPRPFVVS